MFSLHFYKCQSVLNVIFAIVSAETRSLTETVNTSSYLFIYILGVFTEKTYSKSLASNAVYIPMTTLSHVASLTSK